jgi:multidrug efflux pump subunit AcrB
VRSVFTTVGGFVFGRSAFEASSYSGLQVQLKPLTERGGLPTQAFIDRVEGLIRDQRIPGLSASLYTSGIRGIRFSTGDDDLSLRIKGPDLPTLITLADRVVERLKDMDGLRNVQHSNDSVNQELIIRLDRQRAADFGLDADDVGNLLRFALEGRVVTDYIDGDRGIDVLLRLDRADVTSPGDLKSMVVFSKTEPRTPIRLGDLARIEIVPQPETILRDRQQRSVEITASLAGDTTLEEALEQALAAAAEIDLPAGYSLYEAGSLETLQKGRDMGRLLLGLALFLVLVAMAVQYESLRNPLIILISVPFALIGVTLGLNWTDTQLSMPVWLGLIMLAGIVVNNAIVLVEYIELRRRDGDDKPTAIITAARLRLRPILMTTLTTVFGMLPLALALGEGSEMLQPLAITIVAGLSFSTLVSLLLVPMVYRLLGRAEVPSAAGGEARALVG